MDVVLSATKARWVIPVCFAVAVALGFDVQVMGPVSPQLAPALALDAARLGWAFAAGNMGLLVGSMLGGRIGDERGRRSVLTVATALFGLTTLITPYAPGFVPLVCVRLLAGIGIGAAIPNLVAFGAAVSVQKARFSATAGIFWGSAVGGMGPAAVVSSKLPIFDWRSVFLLGGAMAIGLCPFLGLLPANTKADTSAGNGDGGAFAVLFYHGRWRKTLLIWLAFVSSFSTVYLSISWLPLLAISRGMERDAAPMTLLVYNLAGTGGILVIAQLCQRTGARWPAGLSFVVAGISLLALSSVSTGAAILAASAMAGLCLSGGAIALYALVTLYYPQEAHGLATGVSMAMAHLAATIAPLAAGLLLNRGISTHQVLLIPSVSALVAGLAIATLDRFFQVEADGPQVAASRL